MTIRSDDGDVSRETLTIHREDFWGLSDSDNLPAPEVIAAEIIEDLQAALDQLKELETDLRSAPNS